MKFLPVNKEQIPVNMSIVVEGKQYELIFNYNSSYDFFTVTLTKDGVALVVGEKMVLDRPLFETIISPFKETYFIPMDLSSQEQEISYENFGDKIFIWVFVIRDGQVIEDE